LRFASADQIKVFSDCLKRLYDKTSVGRLIQTQVRLHWRLCRRSWCASDQREAYECQSSAVCLDIGGATPNLRPSQSITSFSTQIN